MASEADELPIYRNEGRGLGLVFNLTVLGREGSSNTVTDLPAIMQAIVEAPIDCVRRITGTRRHSSRRILQDVCGVVFPGESLLVLGRPGAGCTTTLKVLANQRDSFDKVIGECSYADIPAVKLPGYCRSDIIYNDEDDIHHPKLSVSNTLRFSLGSRMPDAVAVSPIAEKILGSLGISHTKDTIVGNAFIRGVSGGERKRVSLAEVLSTNPALVSWDNPIRGLDSSSALSFLRLLKRMSAANAMSHIVTLYQASENMYSQCFDRVLVLYEGRMIFSGRAKEAKQYFIDLGFDCPDRQTTPDFLTAVTSPAERRFRPDYHGPKYTTPDTLAQAFRDSQHFQKLQLEMATYRTSTGKMDSDRFTDEARRVRSRWTVPGSVVPASPWRQIRQSVMRRYQLLLGDWKVFLVTVMMCAINAVVTGSAYFMAPKTSVGSFEKGGALFFALIYFALNSLTEVPQTINSRLILLKQCRLGLIHPANYALATALADAPLSFLQTLVFSCCYYFMIGTIRTASAFWIFFLIVFIHYCAVTSLFRMLGAWAPNLNVALLMGGSALPVACLYSGYAPTVPSMKRWGSWIRRIAPSPWALEAMMGNEFETITLHCTESELIPRGPGYDNISFQGCPIPGNNPGSAYVPGAAYLEVHYQFFRHNLWRNFGIMLAMLVIYVVLSAVGLSIATREDSRAGTAVYKRGAKHSSPSLSTSSKHNDIELQKSLMSQDDQLGSRHESSSASTAIVDNPGYNDLAADGTDKMPVDANANVFTFSHVGYFIQEAGREKQLLRDISGFIKPGQLTALMGASGAGKTTLLDTISGRKSEGRVVGEMLLADKHLGPSFSRSCGFCQQQDIHEPLSTVREALLFSARLRQPAHVPDEKKVAEVDSIISLLELEPIADALIGEPGDGLLNVEERKRVTIGVELAAKPSALLVLDEPTSGLDSQAAYSIVAFLRRVAAQGTPIVCTIHQPSGVIFDMFHNILLLAPGGRTVYFGKTGPGSSNLVEYFARNGRPMSKSENPAEFILSAVSEREKTGQDWAEVWKASPEHTALLDEINLLRQTPLSGTKDEEGVHRGQGSEEQEITEYALPLLTQVQLVTQRQWVAVWRIGPYNFSRLFSTLFFELFVAFTFFRIGPDIQGLQNHMLALLLGTWAIPTVAGDAQALWFSKWALFEARERNGIYSYQALLLAIIAVEAVWTLITYTLIFLVFYWTVGFDNSPEIVGYVYLMMLTLGFFGLGWTFLIAAVFPNATMAGFANALFWMILAMFNGGPLPHSAMNGFYKPWLFWVDPLRYYLGGVVASVLKPVRAACNPDDLATFASPPGQTCAEYAAAFLADDSSTGYLISSFEEGVASSLCGYCQYSSGSEYAESIGYYYGDRWWSWAVFFAFGMCNLVLLFGVTAVARVHLRRWKQRWLTRA